LPATSCTRKICAPCAAATIAAAWEPGSRAEGSAPILVVTTKGKIIRFHAGDVSSQGRNTMGVRIIDLETDDRVGSVARVEAEQAPAETT
jgi:DNA gyrase/topoisomerase IV subunit A